MFGAPLLSYFIYLRLMCTLQCSAKQKAIKVKSIDNLVSKSSILYYNNLISVCPVLLLSKICNNALILDNLHSRIS